jgi:4-oxalocrotonate tautomerase
MPIITVSAGAVDVERKRKLVDGLTKVASEVYSLPPETVVVIVNEHARENIGVGGVLLADRKRKT